MTDSNAQQNELSPPAQGPGDRLQSARIAKGLTLEDVANKMHLSTGILTSLEENNFEDITAPIFVKGYLRAYARLVKVNEEDIIKQYITHYMDGDPPISSISNTAPEINANDARVKWTTYLVILGLIGLLSTWWWNRYQQSPETLSLETEVAPSLIAEPEPRDIPASNLDDMLRKIESSNTNQVVAPGGAKPVESLQQNKTVAPLTALANEAQSKPELAKPVQNKSVIVDAEKKIEAIQEQATTAVESTPTTENLSAEQVIELRPTVTGEEVTQAGAQNDLQITVNADTWTSIEDADGNKLVYDLLRSGQQLSVTGKAPINAFFGNGYGVELVYLGKPVDLSRVIRPNNTARIKLGQ